MAARPLAACAAIAQPCSQQLHAYNSDKHAPAPSPPLFCSESPIAGGQTYGGGEGTGAEAREFSNVMFRGEGILDSHQVRAGSVLSVILPSGGRLGRGVGSNGGGKAGCCVLGMPAGLASDAQEHTKHAPPACPNARGSPACTAAVQLCAVEAAPGLHGGGAVERSPVYSHATPAFSTLANPLHLLPQDDARAGAGAGANPLYETNQSQLSAPDSPGAYGDATAAAAGAGTSVGASMMSARSRQVRCAVPAVVGCGGCRAVRWAVSRPLPLLLSATAEKLHAEHILGIASH